LWRPFKKPRPVDAAGPEAEEREMAICVLLFPARSKNMAKLTTARKKAEPKSDFGLPEQRKYPMPDKAHARNAKARASQAEHGGKLSASDKKKIDAKADKILKKK
jgi:hypothetical protein